MNRALQIACWFFAATSALAQNDIATLTDKIAEAVKHGDIAATLATGGKAYCNPRNGGRVCWVTFSRMPEATCFGFCRESDSMNCQRPNDERQSYFDGAS